MATRRYPVQRLVPVPETAAAQALERVDYSDAFAVDLPPGAVADASRWAAAAGHATPMWFRVAGVLMNVTADALGKRDLPRVVPNEGPAVAAGTNFWGATVEKAGPGLVLMRMAVPGIRGAASVTVADGRAVFATAVQYDDPAKAKSDRLGQRLHRSTTAARLAGAAAALDPLPVSPGEAYLGHLVHFYEKPAFAREWFAAALGVVGAATVFSLLG